MKVYAIYELNEGIDPDKVYLTLQKAEKICKNLNEDYKCEKSFRFKDVFFVQEIEVK